MATCVRACVWGVLGVSVCVSVWVCVGGNARCLLFTYFSHFLSAKAYLFISRDYTNNHTMTALVTKMFSVITVFFSLVMMKSCPKTTELWTISWHFYVFTKSNFRQVSAIYVKKRFFVFLPELKGCCWSETEPSCGRKIVIDSFGAICFVFGVGECCRRERKLPRHPSGWLSPDYIFSLIDTVMWKVAHSTPQARSQCRSARVFGLAGLKYLALYQPQGVAIASVVRWTFRLFMIFEMVEYTSRSWQIKTCRYSNYWRSHHARVALQMSPVSILNSF